MNLFDDSLGTVKYNNFNIDFTRPFEEQEDHLTEDLLQIEFSGKYLIDLGWYPEFEANGTLVLTLIENYDWEKPVYRHKSISESDLKRSYEEALSIINQPR